MLILLRNAKAINETKTLNPEKLVIKNVFVNQTTEGRRPYLANASINDYCLSSCRNII